MLKIDQKDPKQLKKIGLYLLIVLSIIRFVSVPLNNTVKEKKTTIGQYLDTYQSKVELLKRHRPSEDAPELGGISTKLLHSNGKRDSTVQTEILSFTTRTAEEEGLSVINFELIEAVEEPLYKEIPIFIRLKGNIENSLEFFKAIQKKTPVLRTIDMEFVVGREDCRINLRLAGYVIK